jgi:hypothetical protein
MSPMHALRARSGPVFRAWWGYGVRVNSGVPGVRLAFERALDLCASCKWYPGQ